MVDVPTQAPSETCDVIMKGGITSAVVYPRGLAEFAKTYRLRGLGGTSAGAIGAVAGAAAEYGRATGGFTILEKLPEQLYDGALERLFIPGTRLRRLFRVMKAATASVPSGQQKPARWWVVTKALLAAYWFVTGTALVLVAALLIGAALTGGGAGWLAAIGWALVVLVLAVGAVGFLLYRTVTRALPENNFGICKGLGAGPTQPGFTDWLSEQIQALAGRSGGVPLTFGDLMGRDIDLRMMTTCINLGRPYELPTKARNFYYERDAWATLFPAAVMVALDLAEADQQMALDSEVAALKGQPPDNDLAKVLWKRRHAQAQHLRQLPPADALPVIVATRLSLSYPLLISAVPMWTIDYRDAATQGANDHFDTDVHGDPPLRFVKVWFTDGGFSSNFPVHFFDAALPARPSYIVNLGRFPEGQHPDEDQTKNIQYETSNRWLPPEFKPVADGGFASLKGFGAGAFNTARNWHDNSYLDFPGFRDRIVRVLQTKAEGGLNLNMEKGSIDDLSDRGQVAARCLVDQFRTKHYPDKDPKFTGWENHQWVRYRALLSSLPEWLDGWKGGRRLLTIPPRQAPSYRLFSDAADLADRMSGKLDDVAAVVPAPDPPGAPGMPGTSATPGTPTMGPRTKLTREPSPLGGLHRVPPT